MDNTMPKLPRQTSLRLDREALEAGAGALRYRAERLYDYFPEGHARVDEWRAMADRLDRMASRIDQS